MIGLKAQPLKGHGTTVVQALASSQSLTRCLSSILTAGAAQGAQPPPLLISLHRCLTSLAAVPGRAATAHGDDVLDALR